MGLALQQFKEVPELCKELRFVEQSKLDIPPNIIQQIVSWPLTLGVEFNLSVPVGGVNVGIKPTNQQARIIKRVERLIKRLEKHKAISLERPTQMVDAEEPRMMAHKRPEHRVANPRVPFVFERVVARRVTIPPLAVQSVPDLKGISVWVCDPLDLDSAVKNQNKDEFSFTQTFLYLIEAQWNIRENYTQVYSGTSALKFVVNYSRGINNIDPTGGKELFGRSSRAHPIKKLEKIGATVSTPELIEVLYRKRYITDEQITTHRGKSVRVCDLVGYPIYIASCLS